MRERQLCGSAHDDCRGGVIRVLERHKNGLETEVNKTGEEDRKRAKKGQKREKTDKKTDIKDGHFKMKRRTFLGFRGGRYGSW